VIARALDPRALNPGALDARWVRWSVAVLLAVSGYVHAELYVTGYRQVHVVGVLFLIQASASFALVLLLGIGAPPALTVLSGLVTIGALGGFLASRTVGVFGFTERGLQPAPQALISLIAEVAILVVLVLAVRPARTRTTVRVRTNAPASERPR
jgi:hypothetical protein